MHRAPRDLAGASCTMPHRLTEGNGEMLTSVDQARKKSDGTLGKIRNYNEIIEYLNALKPYDYSEAAVMRMKQLDKALDNPSLKIDLILVCGTNGKSLAIHFAAKLLKEEQFKVGTCYSTHLLSYNERICTNFETISNKAFTDSLNEVIRAAELENIAATAYELLNVAALIYCVQEKLDVALLEVAYGGKLDALCALTPKIAALTRIADDQVGALGTDLDQVAFEMLEIAKPNSWFISAEQSKIRLQKMKAVADEHKVLWAMPIRKLSALPYIYEQLYGRVASLGERIAQIYVEDIKSKFSPFLRGNLLATEKGRRGRPTLEAKRNSELNPIKTLKGFWTEQFDLLKGRFELLDKEKPSLLLDNASNLDALNNLFLGIRLLHYQRPLKGLSMIMGLSQAVDATEALKLVRYLLKKVNGAMFFVPLPANSTGIVGHSAEHLANIAKDMNIKARACVSLEEAVEAAKTSVDERDGLVVVTGASDLITNYWHLRGIKKF
jgi:folylpolyglutamate synthase/dihydrofolate synthase